LRYTFASPNFQKKQGLITDFIRLSSYR
jgi:hypothetical protein